MACFNDGMWCITVVYGVCGESFWMRLVVLIFVAVDVV